MNKKEYMKTIRAFLSNPNIKCDDIRTVTKEILKSGEEYDKEMNNEYLVTIRTIIKTIDGEFDVNKEIKRVKEIINDCLLEEEIEEYIEKEKVECKPEKKEPEPIIAAPQEPLDVSTVNFKTGEGLNF